MNRTRETLHIRMSAEGKTILELLQEHHGITQTAIVEMLLRKEAREVGIPVSAYRQPQGAPKGSKEEDHRGETAAA